MKRLLKIALIMIMCLGFFTPVLAEDNESTTIEKEFPDLEAKGSVTVNFNYKDGDTTMPVTDGEFAIWQLAKAIVVTDQPGDGGYKFEMTETIGSFAKETILDEEGQDFGDLLLAAKDAEKPSDPITKTNTTGSVTFEELECGVYLVYQITEFSDYKNINPFLVTIPYYDTDSEPTMTEDGTKYKALYDVTAEVKMELDPEIGLYNPCVADPPVKKIVEGNNAPDIEFEFYFERMDQDNPMPEGHDGYKISEDIVGTKAKAGETKEFGDITFTRPGEYYYKVYEVKEGNGEPNFTYDTKVYIYRYIVNVEGEDLVFGICEVYEEGGSEEPIMVSEEGNPDTVVFEFTNRYKKPVPPDIPFTGQYWWPMYVLIIAGAVFTGLGFYRKRLVK
ncbi:MAG: hypothetical protein IIZ11_00925 [Erysipelotrichaceae bacterium]|nr:hypothetical protein [Erysipelotrichaceae bacterium]